MLPKDQVINVLSFISAHNHLREGLFLNDIIEAERYYSYLVAMGNLSSPTDTAESVMDYDAKIERDAEFTSIPTLMLTKRTSVEVIEDAYERGIRAVKFLPGSTSTNSDDGISFFDLMEPHGYYLMDAIVDSGMLFLVHAELSNCRNGAPIDEFARCARALPFLEQIVFHFGSEIKMVVEHANDRLTIEFVRQASKKGLNVWATIRPHDTILTWDDVCDAKTGKVIHPLNYAKPIAKTEDDRLAALEAMVGGEDCFFYGPDSAPHPLIDKMNGKAGIFVPSWLAIPLVVQTFERTSSLHKLQKFTVDVARKVYGLPEVKRILTLKKTPFNIPQTYHGIPVFLAGKTLDWQII